MGSRIIFILITFQQSIDNIYSYIYGRFGGHKVMIKHGIEELKNVFEKFIGKDAVICTFHQIFGKWEIRCTFNFFMDDQRLGIRIREGDELYVYRDKLYIDVIDNHILLADDMLRMEIFLV